MQIILFSCKNRGFACEKVAKWKKSMAVNTIKKKVMRCQVSCRV